MPFRFNIFPFLALYILPLLSLIYTSPLSLTPLTDSLPVIKNRPTINIYIQYISVFYLCHDSYFPIYDVNSNNHDECMKVLDNAGIYLILDIPNAFNAINHNEPSWNIDLHNHYTKKIDAFIIDNEVTNSLNATPASAYAKAAICNVKDHIKSKGKSTPVGYPDNDNSTLAKDLVPFFSCGDDAEARIDLYSINIYRWCGNEINFQTSEYSDVTNELKDFSISVFFSECGCNKIRPHVFSGSFMYGYSEEESGYGIAKVSH